MRRRGFTLIEALACAMVAAILARASALATASLATTLRVSASTRTLAQTMRETRARAMAEGQPLDVTFDAATSRWSVRTTAGITRRVEALPEPLRFVSLPASERIRFTSTGTADNGTVVVGAGTATARIVVNQRGRVRLG
jgi:prepilin-type N-terminal cleavage/methylation domain-containing protein